MAGPVGTCIVSVVRGGGGSSDDRGHELVQQAMANKRALCEACGFRCLLDSSGAFGAHGRHPSWDKVMALQHALRQPECELAVWADADVIFYRPFRLPRAGLFSSAAPMAAGRDYGGLNSGLLWFARSPISDEVLRRVWREEWWNGDFGAGSRDQAAFHHVLRHRQTQLTILENVVRYHPGTRYATRAQKRNRSLYAHTPAYHHAGCSLFRKHATQAYAPPSFCADHGADTLRADKPGAVSCCQRHFAAQLDVARKSFSERGGGCPEARAAPRELRHPPAPPCTYRAAYTCAQVPLALLAPRQMSNRDTHLTARQRRGLVGFYRLEGPALAAALAAQRANGTIPPPAPRRPREHGG